MRFDHYSNVIFDEIGLVLCLVYFISFEIRFYYFLYLVDSVPSYLIWELINLIGIGYQT